METILIIDYGSQYNQLISRRIRELGVYSEIISSNQALGNVDRTIAGIILSGGPMSVFDEDASTLNQALIEKGVPVLGICYGMQAMVNHFGGTVVPAGKREYGKHHLSLKKKSPLIKDIDNGTTIWMSHSDRIECLPEGFEVVATSKSTVAVIADEKRRLYGVQFHPEVTHTKQGKTILKHFVFDICGAKKTWDLKDYIENTVHDIKKQVGDGLVILGLSGGVDSSVTAALIHRAINTQLKCIFVDTGLLRKHEAKDVMEGYDGMPDLTIEKIDASKVFFEKLKGVTDPEQKRKIIGSVFFSVFAEAAKSYNDATFLAQGTIYPDVIESRSVHGPSATIKSHHNVGGVPKKHGFRLLEPLNQLFKDEVRSVGEALGLSDHLIGRHPFPGPGLAIRIIGEVTSKKAEMLREADFIFTEMLRDEGLYDKVSQAFCVLLPVKTVGVMGDRRTHEFVCAIRSVDTVDFMTAESSDLPHAFLRKVSTRIINEVSGINRLVYDITSKPPGTIEWE